VRGSHHYLRRAGEPGLVVVPVHGNRDLPAGTLRAILRQAQLTRSEFLDLL
jgi:predicted RNA binding protein YcfA (HicA-like mRNA interferase family)